MLENGIQAEDWQEFDPALAALCSILLANSDQSVLASRASFIGEQGPNSAHARAGPRAWLASARRPSDPLASHHSFVFTMLLFRFLMELSASVSASRRRGAGRCLVLLAGLLAAAPQLARAQTAPTGKVGIGTTAPTQTLDVNGQLRVRGLSGTDTRLPTVGPDGTLGVSAPVFSTAANTATPIPGAATGTAGTGSYPSSVAVSGNTVYVVSFLGQSLQTFDVSNPASPVLLGQATLVGQGATSVAVVGTTAYVGIKSFGGSGTLQSFDVSNPASPVSLGTNGRYSGNASVAVSSTLVCVVDFGSTLLDAYVRSSTGGLSQYPGYAFVNSGTTGSNYGQPTSVALSGTTAFVTLTSAELQVMDVSAKPPVRTGRVTTASNPLSVVVSGTTAYVASDAALQTFNIANPNSPVLLSTVPTGGSTVSVAVGGTRAYVASGTSLQVFDVANPASPVLLGTVPLSGTLTAVAASGSTAYVTSWDNTLQVVAVTSTPPDRVVTVGPTGSLASVALPGAADFVQNQTTRYQPGGFSVSGAGTVGGQLTAGSATIAGNGSIGGNLGVGTSSPSQKLEVAGGIKFTGAGSTLTFPDGTTQATATSTTAVLNQTTQQAGASFNISGNGTIGGNSTVTGSGSIGGTLGIGTTAPAGGLHVLTGNGGVTSGAGAILNGPPTGNPNLELRGGGTATTPYLDFAETSGLDFSTRLMSQSGVLNVYGASTTSTIFRVNGSATVLGPVTAQAFSQNSDARFKTHVRPLGGALASVLAMRGVRYEWNALGVRRGGRAGAPQVGLLAQELEKVYPELVSTDAQGYKSVNYAQLTPVLIEAIKELKAENEALKAGAAADHASLLTLQAQMARLLGEAPRAQR
jgi:hypothetical protein